MVLVLCQIYPICQITFDASYVQERKRDVFRQFFLQRLTYILDVITKEVKEKKRKRRKAALPKINS